MRRALVIGIDKYPGDNRLSGCENDAIAFANTIERNGDGSPNFSVRLLTTDSSIVKSSTMDEAVNDLFQGDAETVLLYFAGHGVINPATNAGYLVSQNGTKPGWGISLAELLERANNAYPRIQSTVIILDCCGSGYAGEVPGLNNSQVSHVGTGVTILTACHRDGTAAESSGHGLFTSIILDALSGASADICGRITPASLYSHVDQTLGPWKQRPNYKANVQTFITLRTIAPKVPLEVLRRLPTYFPNVTDFFQLDPSFEPDRNNIPDHLKHIPVNHENARVFSELQLCNRYGLVIPVDAEHMYYAAINSTSCRLTSSGAHFRNLAEMGRI